MKWVGQKPVLTPEQFVVINAVLEKKAEVRRILASLPSTKQLSAEWNVSETTVRNYMKGQIPKRYRQRVV